MTSPQRLPTSLTPLDKALDALLQGVEPVAPVELTLVGALRCIAADMPPLSAYPPCDVAAVDGYAFGARDLVGASSYSPLPLTTPPVWVEAGPFMSVSTPILTRSSETCAGAAVEASIATALTASAENLLENIPFPPWSTGASAVY